LIGRPYWQRARDASQASAPPSQLGRNFADPSQHEKSSFESPQLGRQHTTPTFDSQLVDVRKPAPTPHDPTPTQLPPTVAQAAAP
jgi:hypothetical protein